MWASTNSEILSVQVPQPEITGLPDNCLKTKGFYCSQNNGWESPTRSQLTEREIQISSEAISVTNTAFVGEGVVMIVAVWTLRRWVGEICDKKREVSEQAKTYA